MTPKHGGPRPGAGAKPRLREPVTVAVALPRALLRRVDAYAKATTEGHPNRSRAIRALLLRGLEATK